MKRRRDTMEAKNILDLSDDVSFIKILLKIIYFFFDQISDFAYNF